MNNPAFIVDGYTEKYILQILCPGKPIARTDLNGKDVTIPALSKKIASLVKAMGDKHYPVIILVDKEKRKISADEMKKALEEELSKEDLKQYDIRIGVADIMIENWIVADWEALTGSADKMPPKTDGINGAATIKKIKKTYHKTTDGVSLYLKANPKTIYYRSESFRTFVDQLKDIECPHLIDIETKRDETNLNQSIIE